MDTPKNPPPAGSADLRAARDALDLYITERAAADRHLAHLLVQGGAVVRRVRNEAGISLRGLAARCGMSATYIHQAERGLRSMNELVLLRLLEMIDERSP